MEAAATPNISRRKRVRATEETSIATPKGSVVIYEVAMAPVGGEESKGERKARLAFNRQSKCRALQEHNKNKDNHEKADQVQRQHLRCPPAPRVCWD